MRRGLVIAALLCVSLFAPAAHATFPGPNGQVVFDDGYSIARVSDDGSSANTVLTSPVGQQAAWSPDDRTIALSATVGGNTDIYTVRFDGTALTRVTTDPAADTEPAWSPDGQSIVFTRGGTELYRINVDGTLEAPLRGGTSGSAPNWSPDGQEIAFVTPGGRIARVGVVAGPITQVTGLGAEGCCDFDPNWSPDGQQIAFDSLRPEAPGMYKMDADGSSPTRLTDFGNSPSWSPDGAMIAYRRGGCGPTSCYSELRWMHADGTLGGLIRQIFGVINDPDWGSFRPEDIGYPRPKGATPLRVALVPAYDVCTAPNRTHGPPLAVASCAPPVQSSTPQNPAASGLTFGTPDANGKPAQSTGVISLNVVPGDVRVDANLTDVRCRVAFFACPGGPLSDYAGEVQGVLRDLRVTDHEGATSTIADLSPLPFTVPCAATPSSDAGSTCAVTTTFNTLVPGVVVAGKRATWQLGRLEVLDGGGDGDAEESEDNELLATQGIFVP